MQRHIPGGWFFALFELNGHSSCTKRIEMPVIKNLGGKPIETPSSTHFQTRSQRKEKLKKGVAPPQQELEKSVAGNNSMKNRTHYVPYQSQDAKNTENTPVIKNVKTVESPCSNSGCFELNNDNVQNTEFDSKPQNEKPRTFACKKENLGSSNCKSNALNNKTMQSSITFSQANTVDNKARNFTEEKGEDAVKKPHLNNREHIQLGSHNILDMDDTASNSEKAENENDLVDNQDFYITKQYLLMLK